MPMFRRSMIIVILIGLMAMGWAAYRLPGAPEAIPLDAGTREKAATKATVYVTGAVAKPGVTTLREGERVEQAIAACGGFLPQADASGVNLAQPIKDGMQIRVPERADADGSARAANDGLVHINTADEKALDALPGVGPVTAKRIVEYRTEHGAFQAVEELMKVRGIGSAKFEQLKDKIAL